MYRDALVEQLSGGKPKPAKAKPPVDSYDVLGRAQAKAKEGMALTKAEREALDKNGREYANNPAVKAQRQQLAQKAKHQ
jgi:hypothetical protein